MFSCLSLMSLKCDSLKWSCAFLTDILFFSQLSKNTINRLIINSLFLQHSGTSYFSSSACPQHLVYTLVWTFCLFCATVARKELQQLSTHPVQRNCPVFGITVKISDIATTSAPAFCQIFCANMIPSVLDFLALLHMSLG